MCNECGEWVTIVHLRPTARYFYCVVFNNVISGRSDCVCRHGKGNFCLGIVVYSYAFQRPARKSLARFGGGCRYRNAVAVVCFDRGRCDTAVHLRRAARYGYGIVDIFQNSGYIDVVSRHGDRKRRFGEIQSRKIVHSLDVPTIKPLAYDLICRKSDLFAELCRLFVCRAVFESKQVCLVAVIGGRRNCVCRHCKCDFGFGLVVHGYAFNRPARELLARCGRVCRDFDGCSCGILAASRTAVDGHGICSGGFACVVLLILVASNKDSERQDENQHYGKHCEERFLFHSCCLLV